MNKCLLIQFIYLYLFILTPNCKWDKSLIIDSLKYVSKLILIIMIVMPNDIISIFQIFISFDNSKD